MSLLEAFKRYIKKEELFSPKDHLLVAVSGGVDSIVLCHLCKAAGYSFSMAHCNFQLRDEESNGDEDFVKAFAKKLEVSLHIKKFETEKYAAENKLSIQVAARELRYVWFAQLIAKDVSGNNSADVKFPLQEAVPGLWVLTAHHADDNTETILMNFFKGSGINGLKGILPKQQHIIRPLLFAAKVDILEYASEYQLTYREDSSNASDKYTRNYFRNQLIPGLEKVFPQVKENLLQNAARFREINMIYDGAIENIKKSLVTVAGSEYHVPVLKLLKTPALKTVLFEIIKPFGFSAAQAEEAEKLLHSESGKYIQSATHRILRNRKWLIISPLGTMDHSFYLLEEKDGEIIFPLGKLKKENIVSPEKIDISSDVAQLSAEGILFPLIIRRWKQGDYFYPLGMRKKKKLSRFFIDQKLSMNQKENTWVLESDKKIIWVIGQRIDDRFKLTANSGAVIKLIFSVAK